MPVGRCFSCTAEDVLFYGGKESAGNIIHLYGNLKAIIIIHIKLCYFIRGNTQQKPAQAIDLQSSGPQAHYPLGMLQ